MHDRLPWYVTGTLDPDESRAFQAHLVTCDACREELAVLEMLKNELEKHGEDLLGSHPPPEQLAALIEGADEPLPEDVAAAVRRHLAICATCTEESSWLKGEAVAGPARPDVTIASGPAARGSDEARRADLQGSRSGARWRPLLAATIALAAVALIAVVLVVKSSRTPEPDVVARYQVITATQRGEGATTVPVRPKETTVRVAFEPDFAAAAFPLDVEIDGAEGKTVFRRNGITVQDLSGGRLLLDLPRRPLPDGDYILSVTAANNSEPPEEYPIRITTLR